MLSEAEQRLFARLSVFSGGWTLAAAEEVCADEGSERDHARLDRARILDVLAQLIDKSLVLFEPSAGDESRYGFLEPVRQFAAECLAQQGAAAVLAELHGRWFTDLV